MSIARLDDRAVVRIAGPDAATLLQNVVTLGMETVERDGIGYGALLTPQGKILWDFILHQIDDGFVADVRAGEAEAFAKRLALYRLRAKVEIAADPSLAVYAAWDGAALTGGRPDPRVAALGLRSVSADPIPVDASLDDWQGHRIALAVPEGGVDFVFGDAFPSDAAMDALNGVAFAKGCFIGQEVVSRMKHRGTGRRRVVAVQGEAPLPEAGTDITAGGRAVARLGSSAGAAGIAVARLDRVRAALDAREVLYSGDLPVTLSLPAWATYDWPAPATAGDE